MDHYYPGEETINPSPGLIEAYCKDKEFTEVSENFIHLVKLWFESKILVITYHGGIKFRKQAKFD